MGRFRRARSRCSGSASGIEYVRIGSGKRSSPDRPVRRARDYGPMIETVPFARCTVRPGEGPSYAWGQEQHEGWADEKSPDGR